VLLRAREVCLSGLKLRSDHQPAKLRVDNHRDGLPAIWLHENPPDTAWIIVDIGPLDWCKLAYQFGHELGHVLCNSWERFAKPQPPTQWLEEAAVEAFSIRGLGLLAASWGTNPPFAGDSGFARFIWQYRADLIEQYGNESGDAAADVAAWFRAQRSALESVGRMKGPVVLAILALLEKDRRCVEGLAAANRWAARTAVSIEEYLERWQNSCREINTSGRLPARLKKLFKVG
jgi:hypothetical protein